MALEHNPEYSREEAPKAPSQNNESLSKKDGHEQLLQKTLTKYRQQYAELSDSVKAEQLVAENTDTSGHKEAAQLAELALGRSLSWTQRREARINTESLLKSNPGTFAENTAEEVQKRGLGGQYSPDLLV